MGGPMWRAPRPPRNFGIFLPVFNINLFARVMPVLEEICLRLREVGLVVKVKSKVFMNQGGVQVP